MIDIPCLQTEAGGYTIRRRRQPTHARTTILSQHGEASCMAGIVTHLRRLKNSCWDALSSRLTRWTKPLTSSLSLQTLADLGRSKSELIAENALLRQPLILLRRQVKRPAYTNADRVLLVFLARVAQTWKQALFIVQPETLLRWHRELFRLYWKRKSKASSHQPKVAADTIALIRQIARENRLWGAERIRGDLLKLGIRVCKRTIQKYMRTVRTHQPRGQKWTPFCARTPTRSGPVTRFPVTDLFFRPLFAFFLTLLKTRRVIHVGVTRTPTEAWVAQQLREATPYGQAPKYLIRDNDSEFGSCFLRVATASGIKVLKTPYHAPRANAICERFLNIWCELTHEITKQATRAVAKGALPRCRLSQIQKLCSPTLAAKRAWKPVRT
jgi:putative transposase